MADSKTAGTANPMPLSKEEFAKLLKTALDPDLDYFDATKSIEAMAEHIRGLHKLINYFFVSLTQQGAAILDIREKMVEHKGAIEMIGDAVFDEDNRPSLIGFEEPKIVIPRKN